MSEDSNSRCKIEFFFDYSSPWTYLAYIRLKQLLQEYNDLEGVDLEIDFRPILVGAVFNTVNPSVYEMRKAPVAAKAKYSYFDLEEWCSALGITIRHPYGSNPPSVFPVNSAKALRGAFYAMKRHRMIDYSDLVFEEYWVNGKDISNPEVLESIASRLGFQVEEFITYATKNNDAKNTLRENTTELMERDGFGSPTMYFNGHMFFGNDRIPLLQRRLDQYLNPAPLGEGSGNHAWNWTTATKSPIRVEEKIPMKAAVMGATSRHLRIIRLLDTLPTCPDTSRLEGEFAPGAVMKRHFGSKNDRVVTAKVFLEQTMQKLPFKFENREQLFGESWMIEKHRTVLKNGFAIQVCIIAKLNNEGYIEELEEFIEQFPPAKI